MSNKPETAEMKISDFIEENIPLNDEERQFLDECIPIRNFPKGTVLLEEGEVARDSYFVIGGFVRSYHYVDGDDRTTAFFVEGDAVASLTSYVGQKPADHYFACVEDSTLAVLNYHREIELYKRFPKFEALCRLQMEEEFGKQQQRLAKFLTQSPEERYVDLLKTHPDLAQRVPQYHLASYLGVKPESLSRIRKRISDKGSAS